MREVIEIGCKNPLSVQILNEYMGKLKLVICT